MKLDEVKAWDRNRQQVSPSSGIYRITYRQGNQQCLRAESFIAMYEYEEIPYTERGDLVGGVPSVFFQMTIQSSV